MKKCNGYVVFDADGVLVHSQPAMLVKARERYGVHLTYKNWVAFGTLYRKVLCETAEEPRDVERELFSIDVLNRGNPSINSVKAIRRIKSLGFTPIVATGRPEDQRKGTLEWFRTRFENLIDAKNIFLKPNGISTFAFKVEIAKRFRAVAIVEDSSEFMTEAVRDHDLDAVLLGLVNQPWNQDANFPTSSYRMRLGNWQRSNFGFDAFINRLKEVC